MFRLIIAIMLFSTLPASTFAKIEDRDNAEMTALFEADQSARRGLTQKNLEDQEFLRRIFEQDNARRARTQELLSTGALSTANDYYHAAFVFQHGADADSYLLAHALAVAATARGHERGPWIAAATLDRYLQQMGHDQIYGTQYSRPEGKAWTMEPYDEKLVPDALRDALGVPRQAAQADKLEKMRAR